MLISTALVMLMTLPGLALFYGGMAKRKDTLNTMAMSFVAYSLASVLWVCYGYSLSFGPDVWGLIGSPSKIFLQGISKESVQGTIPELLFVMFQLTFCAITVALISGSYIERIKFSTWTIFVILWTSLVYVPIAHWVWGGGFLAKLGALDFAGGTVVHINAGIAGLIGSILLGKRKDTSLIPNNLPMVVLGTGLFRFCFGIKRARFLRLFKHQYSNRSGFSIVDARRVAPYQKTNTAGTCIWCSSWFSSYNYGNRCKEKTWV